MPLQDRLNWYGKTFFALGSLLDLRAVCFVDTPANFTRTGPGLECLETNKTRLRVLKVMHNKVGTALASRLKAENVALRMQVDSLTDSTRQVSEGMDREQQRARAAHLVVHNFDDPQPSVVGLKDRALLPGLQEADLLSAERIGPYKGGLHSRPAPVFVKFAGLSTKHAALKSSKDLRAKKVILETHLTPAQQENRRARQGQYLPSSAKASDLFGGRIESSTWKTAG